MIGELTDAAAGRVAGRRIRERRSARGWPRIALAIAERFLSLPSASATNETFSLRWIYRVRASGVRSPDRTVFGPIPHVCGPVSALIVRWSRHRSRDRARGWISRVSLTRPCHAVLRDCTVLGISSCPSVVERDPSSRAVKSAATRNHSLNIHSLESRKVLTVNKNCVGEAIASFSGIVNFISLLIFKLNLSVINPFFM